MSLLTELIRPESRSGVSSPSQWLIDWVHGGSPTSAGKNVNEDSALKYTPFWAAVRIISGTIASLPFLVYRRIDGGGKERADNHRVYTLLHDRPNDYMDALTFIETRQAHVLTYGNGYAEIQRDGGGRPVDLWPLLPDRTFRKISEGGIPYYEVRLATGETIHLPDANVLHIKGLGFDGYTGYNVVSYHKEAIGYGIAVKEYGSRFFGSNASPTGLLEYPGQLSKEAAQRLADSWNKSSGGLSNSHRTQILEEGMKWTKIGVEPEKAQALEVQKYTVDDCSRIFNIPPHKIGSLDRATFSNIEELNIDFVTQTMFYWFRKWEQECNYKLFGTSEKGKMFCEILVDGLLRGNIKSRYEAYNIGRNGGWLSVDDIRVKENMNPLPEGKGQIYLEPLNMKPAGEDVDDGNDDTDIDSNARCAHHTLIKNQWNRVIKKGCSDSHAQTILIDPVTAFASTVGVSEERAKDALDSIVKNRKSYNYDSEQFATLTMQKIEELIP